MSAAGTGGCCDIVSQERAATRPQLERWRAVQRARKSHRKRNGPRDVGGL